MAVSSIMGLFPSEFVVRLKGKGDRLVRDCHQRLQRRKQPQRRRRNYRTGIGAGAHRRIADPAARQRQ